MFGVLHFPGFLQRRRSGCYCRSCSGDTQMRHVHGPPYCWPIAMPQPFISFRPSALRVHLRTPYLGTPQNRSDRFGQKRTSSGLCSGTALQIAYSETPLQVMPETACRRSGPLESAADRCAFARSAARPASEQAMSSRRMHPCSRGFVSVLNRHSPIFQSAPEGKLA